jgi:hypothetical protein
MTERIVITTSTSQPYTPTGSARTSAVHRQSSSGLRPTVVSNSRTSQTGPSGSSTGAVSPRAQVSSTSAVSSRPVVNTTPVSRPNVLPSAQLRAEKAAGINQGSTEQTTTTILRPGSLASGNTGTGVRPNNNTQPTNYRPPQTSTGPTASRQTPTNVVTTRPAQTTAQTKPISNTLVSSNPRPGIVQARTQQTPATRTISNPNSSTQSRPVQKPAPNQQQYKPSGVITTSKGPSQPPSGRPAYANNPPPVAYNTKQSVPNKALSTPTTPQKNWTDISQRKNALISFSG